MAQITTSAGGQVRSHGRKDRIARTRQGVDALAWAIERLQDAIVEENRKAKTKKRAR
jgi:hypothetical protein